MSLQAPLPQPSTDRVKVGSKLRAARRGQGMTIDRLAEATGLSKGFLSRLENDATSPSVATLVSICQVLSLPVGALFETPDHQVIRLETAPLINMGGSGAMERLLTPRREAGLQMIRSTLQPGSSGGQRLYTVNCELETIHVLRGELTVRFTASEHVLAASDTLTFSGREPHSWGNPSTEEAEILWILVPAAWSGSS